MPVASSYPARTLRAKLSAWSAATKLIVQPPNPPPVMRAPKHPGCTCRQFHQQIRLHAAGRVVISHADVSFMHDAAKLVKISASQRRRGSKNSLVFSDHVQAATEDLLRHLALISPQLLLSHVAQGTDVRIVLLKNLYARLHFGTSRIVFPTAGKRMLHHGVADDQQHFVGKRQRFIVERATVDQQRVVVDAATGGEADP